MGKVRIKLDISRLKEEFVFDTRWIKSKEDIDTELGYYHIQQAILSMIEIKEEEFIN